MAPEQQLRIVCRRRPALATLFCQEPRGLPAHAARGRRESKVARVTDTARPLADETSDTWAFSCFAKAPTSAEPSPVASTSAAGSRRPTPLSETVSFQSDLAISNVTWMCAD